MKVAAIVPSLNPNEQLTTVIDGLIEAGFRRIYVVNDGSGPEYLPFFEAAATHPECVVITHDVNRGKGRALKSAFERFLAESDGYAGVVTLDADGQHRVEDVVLVAKALQDNPDRLVLGARDFSQDQVPFKSAYGNRITRAIFRWASGLRISDTQTGLRGIPTRFAKRLVHVAGERYEFETNMLMETRGNRVPLMEVPIQTIYLDNNSASHFRPVADSVRIYALMLKLVLKFAASSLFSTVLDLALFTLLDFLFRALPSGTRLLIATVVARLCSATVNFSINRRVVFASNAKAPGAFVRYAVVCIAQMLCSYAGTWLLHDLAGLPSLLAKLITDFLLFCVSFFVQRKWVFKIN